MRKLESDVSMSGQTLPKTRDLAPYDHRRGKVGWAQWRTRKKQATAQRRRRLLDPLVIQEELDLMEPTDDPR